jgi:predicted DNA-binding transcriptional regulator YafY
MRVPKYPARLKESVEALQFLSLYQDGIAIDDLADTLGIDVHKLKGNLHAYRAGMDVVSDRFHDSVLFLDNPPPDELSLLDREEREEWEDDHQSDGIDTAVWVVLRKADDQGVDPFTVMLDITDIAEIITLAESLYQLEPDNQPLRTALTELRSRWFPDQTASGSLLADSPVLPILKQAEQQQRQVQITYIDEWRQHETPLVIEPLQIRRRATGYEVDVGPVQEDGTIATLLTDNISDPILLAERFERPENAEGLIAANQRTHQVQVFISKSATSTYETLVESVEVLKEDPEPDGEHYLQLELREPIADRLALLLLIAGPGSSVEEPAELDQVGADLAQRLLNHHGLF